MTDSGSRRTLPRRPLSLLAVALLAAACGGGGSGTTPSGQAPVDIKLVSFIPSTAVPAPAVLASVAPEASVAPPIGEPSVAEVTVDYSQAAADLGAFRAAYRAAFSGFEIDDDAIQRAGARLCTYLMRLAGADGSVALDAALAEAEVNEPGYAPEDWVTAFGVATAHYCREYTVE
ncbi:MAG: hypothetical protein ABIZ52_05505 [Candidatus Limnocylindrales bacterium]